MFDRFLKLHQAGDPLILFNIWDAGSARVVAEAGAKAVATGSWSVAAANGFDDGEQIPAALLIESVARITQSVDLPVSVDLETGYGATPGDVGDIAKRVAATGAVGCNIEDRIIGAGGLRSVADQCDRIRAMRDAVGDAFFINARTDVFLSNAAAEPASLVGAALDRAAAYAESGASGFFVPGLVDVEVIAEVCRGTPLPVNVIRSPTAAPMAQLVQSGVARVSHGPWPYRKLAEVFAQLARAAHEGL